MGNRLFGRRHKALPLVTRSDSVTQVYFRRCIKVNSSRNSQQVLSHNQKTGTRSWASVGNPDIRTLTIALIDSTRTHFSGRSHEFCLFAVHPAPSHGFPIVDPTCHAHAELTNHDVFALRSSRTFVAKPSRVKRFSREVDTPRRVCPPQHTHRSSIRI